MSDNGNRGEDGPGTGVVVKATPKAKKPSMYKMYMLNDRLYANGIRRPPS